MRLSVLGVSKAMKLNKASRSTGHRTGRRYRTRRVRLCKGCPCRHPHGDRTGCCSEAHHARTYYASTVTGQDRVRAGSCRTSTSRARAAR